MTLTSNLNAINGDRSNIATSNLAEVRRRIGELGRGHSFEVAKLLSFTTIATFAIAMNLIFGGLPFESTGVACGPQDTTQIRVGDVVEFKERNETLEGRVSEIVGNVVMVKYRSSGAELTTSMQAGEINKVNVFQDLASRKWSDSSGKFEADAKLLRERKDSVVLESADGGQLLVIKTRLSTADMHYLAAVKLELETTNPFLPMAPAEENLPSLPPRDPERPEIEMKLSTTDVAKVDYLRLDDTPSWTPLTPAPVSWAGHSPKIISFDPKSIGRSSRSIKDFFVAANSPLGVLNLHSYGRESELTTWLVRLDLNAGQIEQKFPMPLSDCEIIDLSPNGELVLTRSRLGNNFDQHAIVLWKFGSEQIEFVAGWEASMERGILGHAYSIQGQFTSNSQFCLWSHTNKMVFWNLETNQPEWGVEISIESCPWFSDDGKTMLFGTRDGVTQIDTVSRKFAGFVPVDEGALRLLAVAPDGKRIAILSLRRCRILAVPSGEIVEDFTVPDFSGAKSIRWCPGDQLLVSADNSIWQIDLRLRLNAWQYLMPSGSLAQRIRDRAWFALDNNSRAGALAVEVPSQKSMHFVDAIKTDEVAAFGPGSIVSLSFETPFDEKQVDAIRSKWTQFLTDNQIQVNQDAQHLQFKCVMETSSRKATAEELQRLSLLGDASKSINVKSNKRSVELLEDGRPIWSYQANIDGIDYVGFSRRRGESIEQAMARRADPDPAYFESFQLPKSVTRFPTGKQAGSTTVSLHGAK